MLRTGFRVVAAMSLLATAASQVVPTVTDVAPAYATSAVDIVGPASSQYFGSNVLVLTNGNFAVTDPGFDSPTKVDVGAVYLYDGSSNALISALTGSNAGDAVGQGGLVEVGNSNFVVSSPSWSVVSAAAGAATWVNGTTGLNGVVSTSNSVYGTAANSFVGDRVVRLTNGNYVVQSKDWNTGGGPLRLGAATWGNGAGGTVGAVTSANSLVGDHAGDLIGAGLTVLPNGNYVTFSGSWFSGRGAAAWGNGSGGTTGLVTSANAMTGDNFGDQISGGGGVQALTNGNYVVGSGYLSRAPAVNIGAVTWGNGSTAGPRTTGFATSTNSMFGTRTNDGFGFNVVPLTNGNYVIVSTSFGGGFGAVIWANGATGRSGYASGTNALFGSSSTDEIGAGGVLALTNGNYVVLSPSWKNGGMVAAGAVTWANGATGLFGNITTANSLTGDQSNASVGGRGVALADSNYVFSSPSWDSPTVPNASAVTWANGSVPASGTVTTANSTVGGSSNDLLAADGITALTNGSYVFGSELWHDASGTAVGAVTWRPGGGPSTGVVGPANSLVGSQANDRVGRGSITVLATGNYLVASTYWNNGNIIGAGAATWGSASGGPVGPVSAANSLVGTATDDQIGYSQNIAFADGGFVVFSSKWHGNFGAVSLGGLTGRHGPVSAANSLLGTQLVDPNSVSPRRTSAGSIVVGRPALKMVTLLSFDLTPPVIAPSPNLTVYARASRVTTVVTYPTPAITQDTDTATIGCSPASGSTFPIGVTTITCTATNTDELVSSTTFTVTVLAGPDYVALAPSRLADTRPGQPTADGLFAGVGVRPAGSILELTVAGRSGVPADAVAVALNVTATEPTGNGFVTVYPCGASRPTASNLNFVAGATIPNAVITKIGSTGTVCLFTSQPAQLVVDINGYFPPTTSYTPINPARVLDTRPGQPTADGVQAGSGAVAPGSITFVQITGRVGVPVDASAVALNVTVTEPTGAGYVTVYPCGTAPPIASNLNFSSGSTIPNLVIAKIGAGGNVCIFNQSGAHLIADVNGYFANDSTYRALAPARLLDSRPGTTTIDGQSTASGLVPAGTITTLHVAGRGGVADQAGTVVLNVTATEASVAGFVTVYPCGPAPGEPAPPLASNLNVVGGQTIPNAVITRIGVGGNVCLFNSGATHLITDVNGYFP